MTIGCRRATRAALSVVLMVALAIIVVPTPVAGTTGTLTITTDSTLTENHVGNIVIAADGITLDCAGYNVTGSDSGNGILLDGRTGVTVENCRVFRFQYGIYLLTSTGNTLKGNTATGNTFGFRLFASSDNTFAKNTAKDNENGFFLGESSGNTLTGNTARDNGGSGFFLGESFDNTLEENTADGNGRHGFDLSASSNNTLTGNTAVGNLGTGFFLLEGFGIGTGNTIFHNNIIDNAVQAGDDNPTANDWHHPVLEEGNFWSDYTGADDGSGTGKHAIAGDGIGDTDIPWPGPGFDEYPFLAPIHDGFPGQVLQGNRVNLLQLRGDGQTELSIPDTEASYVAHGWAECYSELSPTQRRIFLDDSLWRFDLSVDGTDIPLVKALRFRHVAGCPDGILMAQWFYAQFLAGEYLGPHTFTGTWFWDQDFDGVVDPTPALTYTVTVDFVDNTPPATTASQSGTSGQDGWFISPVVVTLSAVDDRSGVASTSYRIDGGAWQAYTGPFTVSFEGTHIVEYYSTDVAGNTEAVKILDVKIDTVGPVTSLSLNGTLGENGWYTSTVTVTLTASDPTSGVASVAYRIDDGAWQTYSGPFTVDEGEHTVEYRATDAAGNEEAVNSLGVNIDTVTPTTSIDLSGSLGNEDWYTTAIAVTLTASDATSDVASISYRIDSGVWEEYTGPFTVEGDGARTVEYYATDVAGNEEAFKSFDVKIDTTLPTPSISSPADGAFLDPGDIEVTWSASDATSGIDHFEVSLDDGTPVVLPASATGHTFTGVVEGAHTIAVTAFDIAGNSRPVSVAVTVDTTPPTLSITSPVSGAIGALSSVEVTWSATDATSGIDHFEVSLDGGTPVVLPASATGHTFTDVADGAHIVTITAFDVAGNSVVLSVDLTVDTNILSLKGPYGSGPLIGTSVAIIAAAAAAALLLWRRRAKSRV